MADEHDTSAPAPVGADKSTPPEQPLNNATNEQRGSGVLTFVLWLAVVVLFYVLSFGPVYRFLGASPAVKVIYTPVFWAYWWLPPFATLLDWYMTLWDKHW